ncbi:OmpH family outer membrane protein [Halothiobacillus diazotrophicus]|uniref:OmpH family outer membrane protein n=1 Tax=Halothiobacillus diazotrophicus TaxID=1860122 RepID=UPI0009ED49E6|nr:OmpH family outer membrane protein [Halothiobacillus diazotrophicus]
MCRAARLGVSLLVLLFAFVGQASAGSVKVGYVNSVALMEQAPQADMAKQALEQEFSPREQEINDLQQQVQGLQNKLDKDGASMSDAERTKLHQQIDQKMLRIQQKQNDFQDDLNLKKSEALGKLQQTVLQAIKEVAAKNGYELVVSDGVVYAAPTVNITNLVAERLKEMVKAKK